MRVKWGGGGKRCRPLGRRRELGSMLGEGLWWAGVPVAADWSECRGRQLPARQVVVVRGETLLPSLFPVCCGPAGQAEAARQAISPRRQPTPAGPLARRPSPPRLILSTNLAAEFRDHGSGGRAAPLLYSRMGWHDWGLRGAASNLLSVRPPSCRPPLLSSLNAATAGQG